MITSGYSIRTAIMENIVSHLRWIRAMSDPEIVFEPAVMEPDRVTIAFSGLWDIVAAKALYPAWNGMQGIKYIIHVTTGTATECGADVVIRGEDPNSILDGPDHIVFQNGVARQFLDQNSTITLSWPSAEPPVFDQVRTVITRPFWTSVGRVDKWRNTGLELDVFPAILVYPGGEMRTEGPHATPDGLYSVETSVTLDCYLRGVFDDPAAEVDKLHHDVSVAMHMDHTRGGLAVDTLERRFESWVFENEPIIGCSVEYAIRYREARGDPRLYR